MLGKAEGQNLDWHGHVTALTVAPEYRRLGLARKMMDLLERVSDDAYHGYFVDLSVVDTSSTYSQLTTCYRYVRCANYRAIDMYEGMGYSVYRRVKEYYGSLGLGKGGRDEEDAFGKFCAILSFRRSSYPVDMRKPLSRDPQRRSVRAGGREMTILAREAP